MTIKTENGNVYDLSLEVIEALKAAAHAREAEAIFNKYADYIPRKHRADVWLSI